MPARSGSPSRRSPQPVRYAVVGLGHIAQVAVLPAFQHARKTSRLVALISDDSDKLRQLSRRHGVSLVGSYDDYEAILTTGEVDAVYIALPNHLHRDYTIRAAQAGIHVLCEKPMAVTVQDCQAMIEAAEENRVKLMVAYRLHFDRANLEAASLGQRGRLGIPRIFNSVFTMQVKKGDIRLKQETGGGTLYDIGIYCINAARYLFRSEPVEVTAISANIGEERFREVDEMITATLRYPDERLASFTVSFGAADVSSYRVVGTRGDLNVEPAYEYAEPLKYTLTVNGKARQKRFGKRDQFAAELDYFSRAIRANTAIEPSAREGKADIQIIEALLRSAETGKSVSLEVESDAHPTLAQERRFPPTRKPKPVKTASPTLG